MTDPDNDVERRLAELRARGVEVTPEMERNYRLAHAIASSPAFRESLARIKPMFDLLADTVRQHVAPIVASINRTAEALRPLLEAFARDLPKLLERFSFPNWRGSWNADFDLLVQVMVEEGIQLAWVPPAPVVQAISTADSPPARRAIIARRWRSITAYCVELLKQEMSSELHESRWYARQAADALLAGHSAASQALSANLLDTLIRRTFHGKDRHNLIGSKRKDFDLDEWEFRVAIVLAGVFGGYSSWDADAGEPPPRRFSRHGSAHGVSRRQYSRINAVCALMHVTALLKLIDSTPPEYLARINPTL